MNHPKKHHYVPQFYLKGFSESGETDGRLYVLDQSLIRQWPSTPEGAAYERKMYELEAGTNTDSAAFERMFGKVETKLQPALQRTIDSKTLPDGSDLNILLNLVTMMAIRVPSIRDKLQGFNDAIHKKILRTMIATPHGWNSLKQGIIDQGGNLAADDEEAMRRFINSDDYTVTQGQNWYLRMIAEASRAILPALSARKWVLWVAGDDVPDFVCSDFPVAVSWRRAPTDLIPPGYATYNTLVTFPLNCRMAMVGTFEGDLRGGVVNEKIVASVNAMTCKYADQVYSRKPDFICLLKTGIGGAADVLKALRESRPDAE